VTLQHGSRQRHGVISDLAKRKSKRARQGARVLQLSFFISAAQDPNEDSTLNAAQLTDLLRCRDDTASHCGDILRSETLLGLVHVPASRRVRERRARSRGYHEKTTGTGNYVVSRIRQLLRFQQVLNQANRSGMGVAGQGGHLHAHLDERQTEIRCPCLNAASRDLEYDSVVAGGRALVEAGRSPAPPGPLGR